MKVFLVLLSLFASASAFSQTIGVIKQMKGEVLLYKRIMGVSDPIQVGDVITTGEASFAKIELNDKTVVTIGPSSELDFSKFENATKKRDSLYQLLKGQMRVHVLQKTTSDEKIKVASGSIALGVRGTEFLVNAYEASGKTVSDVALLTGKLEVEGQGLKSFVMDAGQYFNSEDVIKNGASALKKLSPEMLKKLSDGFLPKLSDAGGKVLDLGSQLGLSAVETAGALAGVAAGALAAGPSEEEEKAPVEAAEEKTSNYKKGFKYDLAKEPWDIRDNVMNYKEKKAKNECFFYFYKKLPGAGEEERFRRTRDCDEFEYDL